MVQDLRPKRLQMPTIPSADVVRERIQELQQELAKLHVLLRTAVELDEVDASAVEREVAK